MGMVGYKDYVAGWLDSSIHDFLPTLSSSDSSTRYSLITAIDSNRNPVSIWHKSPELKSIARSARPLAMGLLLPTKTLLHANARKRIFFGFDEILFFPTSDIEPKPDSTSLIGPGRIDKPTFSKLGRWLARNSCSLALGDGEGLNLIVRAHGLVKDLISHSIEQSQPWAATIETVHSAS